MAKLWQITRVPLKITFNKAKEILHRKFVGDIEENFIQKFYFTQQSFESFGRLRSGYFQIFNDEILYEKRELLEFLGGQFLEHNFNLLGTGWINRNHSLSVEEIINKLPSFFQAKARGIFEVLFSGNYKPINFWNDPKSGYIWEPQFYRSLKITLGKDVKQPWELGRMQHLPVLAYCYHLARKEGNPNSQRFVDEFENEILDFVATNPVGYSVQWVSSMDVSIRLANWLFAFDLFVNLGTTFREKFSQIFIQSIYEHIYFIIENLEWSGGLRGNHYFANIVSLIFAGFYLPESELSISILAFAINELISETLFQFLPDGGNFEASTYYHIQVAEMLLLALYILNFFQKESLVNLSKYLPKKRHLKIGTRFIKPASFSVDLHHIRLAFPKEFLERIYKIVKFTLKMRKSNEEIDSFGDNDSGFFIRPYYFFENFNWNGTLYENVLKRNFVYHLIETLSENGGVRNQFILKKNSERCFNLPKQEIVLFPKLFAFDDFGLYIVKSVDYELSLRCGDIGQQGKGGHSHNDQLSFTLCVRGVDFFVDPGLFCYTCSEVERNKYRSAHSHNTLVPAGEEQNLWQCGDVENLFWIWKHRTRANVIRKADNSIIMEHYAFKRPHRRVVHFNFQSITFEDRLEIDDLKIIYFHLHPEVLIEVKPDGFTLRRAGILLELKTPNCKFEIQSYEYSPQYGVKIPAQRILLLSTQKQFIWSIDLV
ncbi:MAG: alginate lyase family protein [Candidatus Kapaibacteriota bacterium]